MHEQLIVAWQLLYQMNKRVRQAKAVIFLVAGKELQTEE